MPSTTDNLDEMGAVILCGGRSRRMGRDKVWVELESGKPMLSELIDRVTHAISSQHIVVAAHADQRLPTLPAEVRVAADADEDQGPMAGVIAGLSELNGQVETALVLACDSPRFETELIWLLARHLDSATAAVPRIGGQIYPLTAIYRVTPVLALAREFYGSGGRRVIDWTAMCAPRFIDEGELRAVDADLASFAACNTPDEFERVTSAKSTNSGG